MPCGSCHPGAGSKERAGFPSQAQCRTCHKDFAGKIPAARVYRLPDYVFFSHSVHLKAKAECKTCHGDVWRQETLNVFRPINMKGCVDCHKQNQATEVCLVCHELGQ